MVSCPQHFATTVNNKRGRDQSLSPLHGVVLRLQCSNPLLCAAGNIGGGLQLRHPCCGVRQPCTQLLLSCRRCCLGFLGPCVPCKDGSGFTLLGTGLSG